MSIRNCYVRVRYVVHAEDGWADDKTEATIVSDVVSEKHPRGWGLW
jgi:hypothetical protein